MGRLYFREIANSAGLANIAMRGANVYPIQMSSAPSLVRRIEANEWQIYKSLRLNALKLAPEAFGSRYEDAIKLPDSEWQERVKHYADADDRVNLIVFMGERAAGMVSGFLRDLNGDREAEMVQMWIEPEFRGYKLGADLIDGLKSWAYRNSCKRIRCDVVDSNSSAMKLYLSSKFVPTGKRTPDEDRPHLIDVEMVCELA